MCARACFIASENDTHAAPRRPKRVKTAHKDTRPHDLTRADILKAVRAGPEDDIQGRSLSQWGRPASRAGAPFRCYLLGLRPNELLDDRNTQRTNLAAEKNLHSGRVPRNIYLNCADTLIDSRRLNETQLCPQQQMINSVNTIGVRLCSAPSRSRTQVRTRCNTPHRPVPRATACQMFSRRCRGRKVLSRRKRILSNGLKIRMKSCKLTSIADFQRQRLRQQWSVLM